MSESQSVSRSRLELARDEVDRVFGDGHAGTVSVIAECGVSADRCDTCKSRCRS
jgi:hypothetical protein